ncbi:hypothetical protein [Kitasatospora sp. NPDC057198]|uniref:hypothetical protein n=1 Tax=Kitasatospora sp. NPDC057198 TaxID=3346046 RepID=UPI003631B94F
MDTRLIQTAVLGSPDSDVPVVCPEDADELDAFRREHADETWWCGTHLPGGCGRRLTTKLYRDRISHFAHYADGGSEHRCGGASRGKDSANHLFVKADLATWLRSQGVVAEFDFPEPIGSAVRARLEDGRILLVHLDQQREVGWDDEKVWEFFLGPGVQAGPEVLDRRGRVHRIRLDKNDSGTPTTTTGVQEAGSGTRWFPLAGLVLSTDGLSAPDVGIPLAAPQPHLSERKSAAVPTKNATVPLPRTAVAPAAAARHSDQTLQALQRIDSALHLEHPGQVAAAVRLAEEHLLSGLPETEDGRELRAAVAKGHRWQEQRSRRRATVVSQLREDFTAGRPVGVLLRQAVELVADEDASNDDRATVADIRTRFVLRVEEEKAKRARLEAERAARTRPARIEQAPPRPMPRPRAPGQVDPSELADIARGVHGALKKAAREGRGTSWDDLRRRSGDRRLTRLGLRDKAEVLYLVDQHAQEDEPLLSVLLTAADSALSLQLYRDVAHLLGRPLPALDQALADHLATERAELHQWWKHR